MAQLVLDKLANLAATFTDQSDDIDVGIGITGDHPKQSALADAAAAENPNTLAKAAGQQSINGADTGLDGLSDWIAGKRIRRFRIQLQEFSATVKLESN